MHEKIRSYLLEKTCKEAIETILLCLEHATKGTIYTIGPMPKLQAVRVTSGIRDTKTGQILWGLPETSDYNAPGKNWEQYQDRPGYLLEAMGWCVERQKSWTADNPYEDTRSVLRQLSGEVEDYYHMEPVLVRKTELRENGHAFFDYPLNESGEFIWQDSEYIVVAMIKIHFLPQTIRRGDRSTKIVKKLSRTLGTELLSLHLRETYLEAQEKLSRQRIQSCNIMAHELRNTLIKFGFVFSAINGVMSFLREQWELELTKAFPQYEDKDSILRELCRLLLLRLPHLNGNKDLTQMGKELLAEQEELAYLFPLPEQGEQWLRSKIQPKWRRLLSETRFWDSDQQEIERLLTGLQKAIRRVTDEDFIMKMSHLPEDLKVMWPRLAYTKLSANNHLLLEEIFMLLEHPALHLRHRQQVGRILRSLRVIVDVASKIEGQTSNQPPA